MRFLVSLLLLTLYLHVPTMADNQPYHSTEYFTYLCDPTDPTTGNYTTNSMYQSNLNSLFSALRSNSTGTGFAAGSVGTAPDMVTGIANCRGDLNDSACSTCLSQTLDILNLCPYYKSALMWYNSCFMYFSSQYFLSSVANEPQEVLRNRESINDDKERFKQAVHQLMVEMKSWAVNNSTKLFATGIATNFSTEYPTIYGLVQCTPDLNKAQCQDCLQQLIDDFPKNRYVNNATIGARTIGIHCNIRYEVYTFYDGPAMVQIDGTPMTPSFQGKKKKTNVIALVVTVTVAAAVLLLSIFCFCLYKKRSHGRKAFLAEKANSQKDIENASSILIEFSTLKVATNNFHESNKIGEGGFGAVYKGVLPNGEEVAVKRLSQNSGEGFEELKNELVLVSKLQQKNLVRVVGVSLGKEDKLLVYEFLPNGSLDTFLFDNEKRQELDWRKRQGIINGVARGLQYLHEDSQLTIIHRDLKASNILLDSHMNPKISDFGLARLFRVDQTAHATNRVVGTFGYMAPEYAMHGIYSIKSDVYSFGVLILEIMTGRSSGLFDAEHDEELLSSVWQQWIAGKITDIVDPVLDCSLNEIIRHLQIGLLCVQENPEHRPRMSEVVVMLSIETVALQAPSKPALYIKRGDDDSYPESTSIDTSLQMSENENSIAHCGPR